MKIIICTLGLLFTSFGDDVRAQDPSGRWSGLAHDGSEETQLVLTIGRVDDRLSASMTLPDIGVTGWPAHSIVQVEDTLTVVFPSDSGPHQMALSVDGLSMTGTWRESRFETAAVVELSRIDVESPISERRILIQGPAGNLGASLIMPACTDGCPGVVFLHGSGPQPRDSNRFAALELAEHGIASIIYDKRGVGESEGDLDDVTFGALATDAIAVANILRQQPGVSSVGFFGHSQGGWIGPLAGSEWPYTAFVINSSGPAVPPSREAEWEVVRQLRAAGMSSEIEDDAREIVQLWHHGVRSGDWSPLKDALSMAKAWFKMADIDTFMIQPDEAFMRSYRAFMDYDPIPALSSLKAPMLAILAPDDESIDAVETELILGELRKDGHNITLKIYPGYDHSIRRLGPENSPIRWPEHPDDYFRSQASFIHGATR